MTKEFLYRCFCDLKERVSFLEKKKLKVTKAPIYEYRDIWAEEGSTLNTRSAEWSFGNGTVGYIGLPIDSGWEVIAIAFQAGTYTASASVTIDLMNYGNTPSDNTANTVASISLSNSTDGGGTTNNAYKYLTFNTPVEILTTNGTTTIGFITRNISGIISNGRVYARLRRKVGDYVTDVTF